MPSLREVRLIGYTPDGQPVYRSRAGVGPKMLADGTPYTGVVAPAREVTGQ